MHVTRQAQDVDMTAITLGDDSASIRRDFLHKLFFDLGKFPGVATRNDHFMALAFAVRDRTLLRWVKSARTYLEGEHRTVIYLSAEYLLGPQLGHNLLNLGIEPEVREALEQMGLSLDELLEHEEEPGLGNGGLGRLAACFMDSLATLDIPAIGHGIRYEFGIFDQDIRNGWQVEKTDTWLRSGNPWEVRRYDVQHPVGLGGHTEQHVDAQGKLRVRWVPGRVVKGVPYDTPALGYRTTNANFLRLWAAVASEEFDLDAFQGGEYWRAVENKVRSENITKVLYPNDSSLAGKQLRLEQQYFFVSCALQDCIRILQQKTKITEFADKFAIQLNDTHPTVAIPELMRLLMDVHGMAWDDAWSIVQKTFSYTNHTLMPEALETWPLPLFQSLLPRHLEIIYEINARFLDQVRKDFPNDDGLIERVSLIDERGEKAVRMANLATVASHTVNGVAALHSRLLTETVLADFARVYPKRFTNVTNGVTQRRFVALANPDLTSLISEAIGDGFIKDYHKLAALEPFAEDAEFRAKWRKVKLKNKEQLKHYLHETLKIHIDPKAMLDAQCKRIHEYKRQHLAALHIISQYDRIRRGEFEDIVPRTFLFAGKAAPAYRMAKLIVRLIHGVGQVIAADPVARKYLSVVFFPDFNVKNAQRIYPAADLSEQISTAGLEASGTGNMKFALNGALTIGTLDGANVEIRDAVGAENFFLFGMHTEEVVSLKARGYHPEEYANGDPELARVLQLIADGHFSGPEHGVFDPLLENLRHHDPFCVLADFRAYAYAQRNVARAWDQEETWTKKAIINVARMGTFSSDRSIAEYAKNIWHAEPVKVS